MVDPTNQNQAGEVVPSRSEPVSSNLPTANQPEPKAEKPPKKEKAPAVEDKPFEEFMQQEYLPALQKAIAQEGVDDLQLNFVKQKYPIVGFESAGECWQIAGSWRNGERKFNVYFPDADIQGPKGFSCSEGKRTSTLESFLIDERKTTLELLVSRLVYRLNGQKWLGRN